MRDTSSADSLRSTVRRGWPSIGPARVRPLRQGANNLVSLVETATGDRYILRVSTPDDVERLWYEIDLVTHLQHAHLHFAVPAPIPTTYGDPLLRVPEAASSVATLWPFVPGTHSSGNNRGQAYVAGRALARLQAALATLEPARPPRHPPPAGELERNHPLVADPEAAIDRLPVDRETRAQLDALLDAVVARIPGLYAALPQQLIHNDYDPSNVLLEGRRVTGVLDWEFSTVDLRAMDLAVGLLWWPHERFGSTRGWAIADAFGQGYARHAGLTPDEIEALPWLIRLRTVATLLHRIGRHLAGRDPEERLVQRIIWTLGVDAWITSTGEELRRRARTWDAPRGTAEAGLVPGLEA